MIICHQQHCPVKCEQHCKEVPSAIFQSYPWRILCRSKRAPFWQSAWWLGKRQKQVSDLLWMLTMAMSPTRMQLVRFSSRSLAEQGPSTRCLTPASLTLQIAIIHCNKITMHNMGPHHQPGTSHLNKTKLQCREQAIYTTDLLCRAQAIYQVPHTCTIDHANSQVLHTWIQQNYKAGHRP